MRKGKSKNETKQKQPKTGLSSSSDPLQASGMGAEQLQGPGDPWVETTPGISFFYQVPVLLFCRKTLQWQHRNLANGSRVATQLPRLECHAMLY